MKRKYLMVILWGISMIAYSQNEVAPDKNNFYGGVAYYYLSLDSELSGYQSTNKINAQAFEPQEWSNVELNDSNNYVASSQTWMAPALMVGMKIYDKPVSPWSLNADLMLGYLFHKHDEIDKNTGTNLLEVKNDAKVNTFSNIEFNLKYAWKKWSFALNPGFSYGIAHSTSITYNYLPEANYDTDYNLRSAVYFPKVSLTGGYLLWNVNIYA